MKLSSRALIGLAQRLPRGRSRIVRFAARNDPALQDFTLDVPGLPFPLRADLRRIDYVRLFCGPGTGSIKLREVLPALVRQGDRVLDIGANIGLVSAVFAAAVGETGSVVAVEAVPQTAACFRRSFAHLPNVTLLEFAVSDASGTAEFYVGEPLSSLEPVAGSRRVTVPTTTVDEIVARHGAPDIMKVDVEGAEARVFAGARATLGSEDCPIVVFESLSEEDLRQSLDILSRLHGRPAETFNVIGGGKLAGVETRKSSDYLFVPQRRLDRIDPSMRVR